MAFAASMRVAPVASDAWPRDWPRRCQPCRRIPENGLYHGSDLSEHDLQGTQCVPASRARGGSTGSMGGFTGEVTGSGEDGPGGVQPTGTSRRHVGGSLVAIGMGDRLMAAFMPGFQIKWSRRLTACITHAQV